MQATSIVWRDQAAKLQNRPAGVFSRGETASSFDVGSYVGEAKGLLEKRLALPTGYRLEWSGQYESMQRASKRLRVVVPITLIIIFALLYFNFRSAAESLIVMLSLPFALAGGVWLMWILGYNLSVAVAIGFIALAGVAAQTAVVLLIYLDHAWNQGLANKKELGSAATRKDLDAAVEFGAVERLRPKMMTVAAVTLSLVPILWSQQTGSDVLKRIAAPMVGGLITSAGLTLIVLPAIYSLWRERELRHVAAHNLDGAPFEGEARTPAGQIAG